MKKVLFSIAIALLALSTITSHAEPYTIIYGGLTQTNPGVSTTSVYTNNTGTMLGLVECGVRCSATGGLATIWYRPGAGHDQILEQKDATTNGIMHVPAQILAMPTNAMITFRTLHTSMVWFVVTDTRQVGISPDR